MNTGHGEAGVPSRMLTAREYLDRIRSNSVHLQRMITNSNPTPTMSFQPLENWIRTAHRDLSTVLLVIGLSPDDFQEHGLRLSSASWREDPPLGGIAAILQVMSLIEVIEPLLETRIAGTDVEVGTLPIDPEVANRPVLEVHNYGNSRVREAGRAAAQNSEAPNRRRPGLRRVFIRRRNEVPPPPSQGRNAARNGGQAADDNQFVAIRVEGDVHAEDLMMADDLYYGENETGHFAYDVRNESIVAYLDTSPDSPGRGMFYPDFRRAATRQCGRQEIASLASFLATSKDTGQTCCICLSQYENGEVLKKLPCSHKYHASCIDSWLLERNNCPIDRLCVFGSRI